MATSLWINGKEALERPSKALIFRQLCWAMVVGLVWALESMAASVRDFVRNIVISKVLLAMFWLAAFLLPWLLLVSSYTLSLYVAVTGKEPRFGKRSKGIQ
jgi:hypothetical protein